MDDGSKLEKSTGSTPPIKAVSESGSAPVESTVEKKESPVLSSAPTRDESLISTGEVSASKILAVQVMMGDFKALKDEIPGSWQSNDNGKIYWCAEFTGHKLDIVDGKLLVDGLPAEKLLEKLLE